jgi:hypothetical protein
MHGSTDDHTAILSLRDPLAVVSHEVNATFGDCRRDRIFELHETKQQGVMFFAWPSDVQVHVIERVDGANLLARGESRPTFHPHLDDATHIVVGGHEPLRIDKGAAARTASSNTEMDVGEWPDPQGLIEGAELRRRRWVRHDPVSDHPDRRAFEGPNIDAGVKPFGAFAAPELADGARDLVGSIHGINRPQKRLPGECLRVELRVDSRRRWGPRLES